DGKVERAPLPRLALDPHSPSHELDELQRNGQAQAGAAVFARRRGVDLRKGLKEETQLLARNADARVTYREMEAGRRFVLGFALDTHGHFARAGELDRVADEVHENLPQPARVADEVLGYVVEHVAGQLEPFGVGAQRQRGDRFVEVVAQIDIDRIEVELA